MVSFVSSCSLSSCQVSSAHSYIVSILHGLKFYGLSAGVFTISGILDSIIYHGQKAIKKKMALGKFTWASVQLKRIKSWEKYAEWLFSSRYWYAAAFDLNFPDDSLPTIVVHLRSYCILNASLYFFSSFPDIHFLSGAQNSVRIFPQR